MTGGKYFISDVILNKLSGTGNQQRRVVEVLNCNHLTVWKRHHCERVNDTVNL